MQTTNKLVTDKLKQHVLANFGPEFYETGAELQNLKDQIDAMQYGDRSIYRTALDYVEGGSFLVYYDDARGFLAELLEQNAEESNRYSDEKVWQLYCHLVARTMAQLYAK